MSFTLVFNSAVTITNPLSGCTWTVVSGSGNTQYTTTDRPTSLNGFNNAAYNSKLTQVLNIPTSVTSIGTNAFEDCIALTSITIPTSVTSIGLSSFKSCTFLRTVKIGSSVTSIGGVAFETCTRLNKVYVYSTASLTVGGRSFSGIPNNSKLYATRINLNNTSLTTFFNVENRILLNATFIYTIQTSQLKDLENVFAPLTTTPGPATKILIENYMDNGETKDLNQIFEPYTSGTQAPPTLFMIENYNNTGLTLDLNQIFKPI